MIQIQLILDNGSSPLIHTSLIDRIYMYVYVK